MTIQNITKVAVVALLSVGLTSCFISAQEEANIALNKWQGKKINDFFFKFGKGEFQAKNSQGKKAYHWRSPKRTVETQGESYVVRVADKYNSGEFYEKVVFGPKIVKTYQCFLRIETTSSGRISLLTNVNKSSECVRYFNLPKAEIDALLEARK